MRQKNKICNLFLSIGRKVKMIKPDKILPKYYQLKEYLKKIIQNGDIIPAQKLPSESDLVRQFKISRHYNCYLGLPADKKLVYSL